MTAKHYQPLSDYPGYMEQIQVKERGFCGKFMLLSVNKFS